MASITREQLNQINKMCSNGWAFDLDLFLSHNEKTLMKHIKIDDENYLRYKLEFNYDKQIVLHISKFYHKPQTQYATTHGMGKCKVLVEAPAKRKDLKKLILLTKDLTDKQLLDINKNTPVSTGHGLIVQSEDF